MKVRDALVEIPQSGKQLWRCLDFIEKQQGFSGHDVTIEKKLEPSKSPLRSVSQEEFGQLGLLFQVDLYEMVEVFLGEHPHKIRLSNLSSATDNQWHSAVAQSPIPEVFESETVHDLFPALLSLVAGDVGDNAFYMGRFYCWCAEIKYSSGRSALNAKVTTVAKLTIEQFTDASSYIIRGEVGETWTSLNDCGLVHTRARSWSTSDRRCSW